MEKVNSYNYQGIALTEFNDKCCVADQLAKSASRAGSKLISVHFESSGLTWDVFSHLYEISYVL